MVNFAYRAARLQGKLTRSLYQKIIPQIVKKPITQTPKIKAVVYALSCERDFPEQVVSLRSFLNHVGIPEQFIIISDGYSAKSCQLLQQIHPCVKIIPLNEFIGTKLPAKVYHYAQIQSMGKKLATLLSIPHHTVSIYTDSDILFFPGASALIPLIESSACHSYYLPDSNPAFDFRLIHHPQEAENPINGGFILFKKAPDWTEGIERFLNLPEEPNYFTEQTIVHLTMHQDCARALPSQHYIMGREDEFIYLDQYARQKDVILRHYVTPVRHKFWGNFEFLF
ncbi:hypothetical protein [Spirulina subsalsa]|uniref:hypothetical protein n=1 Tax=Spirulina subsalsa TaxID=54311 RepID=UPI0002F29571|nr:hypothetical protein [Spirulina subsalsa]